jgi:hypothetical protein
VLKKRRDRKYRKKLKAGEGNQEVVENRKRRQHKSIGKLIQKKSIEFIKEEVLTDLNAENAKLKEQLQKSTTLLQENSD